MGGSKDVALAKIGKMKAERKAQIAKANERKATADARMLTPLNATLGNVAVCSLGGVGFGFGLGAISKVVLKKTSLV